MTINTETRMAVAVAAAVRQAIAIVGVDALRRTSMFPSSRRVLISARDVDGYKLAA